MSKVVFKDGCITDKDGSWYKKIWVDERGDYFRLIHRCNNDYCINKRHTTMQLEQENINQNDVEAADFSFREYEEIDFYEVFDAIYRQCNMTQEALFYANDNIACNLRYLTRYVATELFDSSVRQVSEELNIETTNYKNITQDEYLNAHFEDIKADLFPELYDKEEPHVLMSLICNTFNTTTAKLYSNDSSLDDIRKTLVHVGEELFGLTKEECFSILRRRQRCFYEREWGKRRRMFNKVEEALCGMSY